MGKTMGRTIGKSSKNMFEKSWKNLVFWMGRSSNLGCLPHLLEISWGEICHKNQVEKPQGVNPRCFTIISLHSYWVRLIFSWLFWYVLIGYFDMFWFPNIRMSFHYGHQQPPEQKAMQGGGRICNHLLLYDSCLCCRNAACLYIANIDHQKRCSYMHANLVQHIIVLEVIEIFPCCYAVDICV